MAIIEHLLKRPLIANLAMILIVLVGTLTLFNLNRAGYPNVDFDIMRITTVYPGASAEDVEINVTKQIEDELQEVDGIDRIRSSSLENLSLIFVFIDTNAPNIERVKDDVSRAIDRVTDLPSEIDSKPLVKELRASNVAVLELAIQGSAPELELRKVARDLEDEIKEIPGVSSVEKVGYRKREVKVELAQAKLEKSYISIAEVIQAIRDHNVRVSGGNLQSFADEKQIVTYSEFDRPLDVGKVIIRSNYAGEQIQLVPLATVRDDFEEPDLISRTGGALSINLLIRSHAGTDIINISSDVKETIDKAQGRLPENISLALVSDFSYYTASMLRIVRNNAIMGFLLVLLCLALFLSRYVALWTAAGIPISILGAFSFFPLFGVEINFISLITLVIVLGLIVDDAIVIAENISRHREKGLSPLEAARVGVEEVRWPVITTIITTILAFMSIAFMSGVTGKFVFQIPIVVTLTLLMSLVESLLILPVHIAHSPLREAKEKQWLNRLRGVYGKLLNRILLHRKKALAGFLAFLIGTGLLFATQMKFVLFPYDDIDIFHIIAELPDGYGLNETAKKVEELEAFAEEVPKSEVVNYTTRVGHHDTDVYGASAGLHSNWAVVTIYLKPASQRSTTSDKLIADVRKQVATAKGYERLTVEEFYDGPPIGKPITVTVVGDDDEVRRSFSNEIVEYLSSVKGVRSIELNEKNAKEEIRLHPNYEVMAQAGVTARDIGSTIRSAYEGVVATHITRDGEEIDFRVQLTKDERRKFDVLKKLRVMNRSGKLVPIEHLVRMEKTTGFETIKHYNRRRSATVTADLDTDFITSSEANQQVRKTFEDRINATPGFRLIFGGEEKSTQESMHDFAFAILCTLIAIYFVLTILFNSFVQPIIILAALPFALGGVILVFYAHGLPISFLAMIGILGLVGVVVNDSLILVSHINRLSKKAGITREIIVEGSKERLRAVLLTTITTVAAMLPTIYGFGGAEPFLVPIVLSLAGGLIFGTAVTLILVPTLYSFQRKQT